ncbi:unnamed protein product, partial [Darwinula stevensoni]
CGTLTGIPSHGGGKRFSEEQRLVSASIRSTLKQIDVSPLRGKKVAIIFDMISDEGGGNISENRTSDQKEDSKGGNEVKRQVLSPEAVSKQQQTKGHEFNASATLQYKGLGDYTNMAIPKSDASLLTGLTRTYLLLNEIEVTTPTDPTAEAVLYVAVDIFGIVRSRFDAYVLNQESVKAETGMEMTAFDRSGKMIMRPRNANQEAGYNEIYLFWAGPFASDEQIKPGKGLLDDFSDVVPGKTNYIKKKERTNFGPIDNNKDELDELDNLF